MHNHNLCFKTRLIKLICLFSFYKCRITKNEMPFSFPTISICPQPYQNMSRIQELGLRDNIWSFFQYHNNGTFEGWPIKNSSNAENIWETTTFGFWDMIKDVSMNSYDSKYVINTSFHVENSDNWLYAKVSLIKVTTMV